jgi:hypothetical protein
MKTRQFCAVIASAFVFSCFASTAGATPVQTPALEVTKEINAVCKSGEAGIRLVQKNAGESKLLIKYTGSSGYTEASENLLKQIDSTAYVNLLSGSCFNGQAIFSVMVFPEPKIRDSGLRKIILVTTQDAGVLWAADDIVIQERQFPKNEKVSFSTLCGSKLTSVTIINGEQGRSRIFEAIQGDHSATKDSVEKVNATIGRSRAVYVSSPYCEGKNSVSFAVTGSYLNTKVGEEDDFTIRVVLDFETD